MALTAINRLHLLRLLGVVVQFAALEADGLNAHMWAGCYRVPSPTLTGSLLRDMTLVQHVTISCSSC
jgi:hypothetical protein